MLKKILLVAILLQSFFTTIKADTCNIFFDSSRSPNDGPNTLKSGECFSFAGLGLKYSSAWIEGIPAGAGYLKFYSGHTCEPQNLVTEGPSPISLRQGTSIGSIFVQSCK